MKAPRDLHAQPALPAATRLSEALPPDVVPPDMSALVQHPDGWYWLADSGRQQFGPHGSASEALAAMTAAGDNGLEPGETLFEAEQELGISDWLDPETGEPAEQVHTRLEDH